MQLEFSIQNQATFIMFFFSTVTVIVIKQGLNHLPASASHSQQRINLCH